MDPDTRRFTQAVLMALAACATVGALATWWLSAW